MKYIYIILIACITSASMAQELQFSDARKLGEEVNSDAEEINPHITEDDKVLYFTRTFSKENIGGKYAGQDIWFSVKEGENWSKAKNLKVLNNGDNNAVVGINHAGNRLYLINNYSAHPRRKLGLVSVDKTETKKGWTSIRELPVEIEVPNDHYGFYMAPEEDVLIISMMSEGSLGDEDLYFSLNQDGEWQQPVHMGSVVNSAGYEISPHLSSDKKMLFFASNGLGGEGEADIFYSKRLDDSWTNWSTPVNAGPEVNSGFFDAYFSIADDNQVYFSSNRGGGLSHIYTATMSVIVPEDTTTFEEVAVETAASEPSDLEERAVSNPSIDEVRVAQEPAPPSQTIYFGFASSTLTVYSKGILSKVVNLVKDREELLLELEGHSDIVGPNEVNMKLSKERAMSVKEYLVDNGISNSRVSFTYHGEEKPAMDANTKEEHAKNRRVAIKYTLGK